MKVCLLFVVLFLVEGTIYAQQLKLREADRKLREPYKKGVEQTDTLEVKIISIDFPDSIKIKVTSVEVDEASTYPAAKRNLVSPLSFPLKKDHVLGISLTTDALSDETNYIILRVNYEDTAHANSVKKQFVDTVFVDNTYPFKSVAPEEYTEWNDGKRAEIFIGTNFDFFGENILTDWYGGISIFLPGITDFKYHRGKTNSDARWGLNGGLYHSRSFSNFGNDLPDEHKTVYNRIERIYPNGDSTGAMVDMRYDSLKVENKIEINNWGAYAGVMYQISRFESLDSKFVTNIMIGLHAELIRRNILRSYSFDTLGTRTVSETYIPDKRQRFAPENFRYVYYDSYFGVNLPLQFLWKGILDYKMIPCIGLGPVGFRTNSSGNEGFLPFYLINFDLLARLGGLKLNLGGEIRGYFPNYSPIFSAYLGTSFSVAKLVDFISK